MTDEMILLADCYEDCAMLTNDSFDLDPEISALAAQAAVWLRAAEEAALRCGLTTPQGLRRMLLAKMAAAPIAQPQTTAPSVAHRLIRDGIRNPPRRKTAADKARDEAAKWGHVAS